MKNNFIACTLMLLSLAVQAQEEKNGSQPLYKESYRPQIHFSPTAHWMNDPNGMVWFAGNYHLFFQYYPGGMTWGPMHWGHAKSKDLVHWQQEPIALYPDSLGYIFSGSVVLDKTNTSGFGRPGRSPLVAVFTQHDTSRARETTHTAQNESIAYSLDSGATWTKFSGNPVLKNPGIADFRDPKVMWYEPGKKWVMTLATKDRVTFYSSPDLKHWQRESEFGEKAGAHGGVWECPDLIELAYKGKRIWVLIVSINPGGPNGGSATQYFTGDFDGHQFIATDEKTKWLDYGPDDYAGVTWSNTGSRKLFLGWMSNWTYADKVPTSPWRGATTLPRELQLTRINNSYMLSAEPIGEIVSLITSKRTKLLRKDSTLLFANPQTQAFSLQMTTNNVASFELHLSNAKGEELLIGYDKSANQYFIDRTHSDKPHFAPNFAIRSTAPRLSLDSNCHLLLYVDASSVELFADHGLTVMTALTFPSRPYDRLMLVKADRTMTGTLSIFSCKSIW